MPSDWYLPNLELYAGITERQLCQVAKTSYDANVARHGLIYSPSQPANGVYVIKEGEVELVHVHEGKEAVFETLGVNGVFGDFGLDGTPQHTARATRRSMLCVTPVDDFRKVIAAYPDLTLRLIQNMAGRLRDYEERIRSSNEGARERVLGELLRLRAQRRGLVETLRNDPVRITHEELARKTGLNRVTVTRILRSLKDAGQVHEGSDGGYVIV